MLASRTNSPAYVAALDRMLADKSAPALRQLLAEANAATASPSLLALRAAIVRALAARQ